MTETLAPFALPLAALFVYMCVLFCIALWKKDNSIADIGYGGGFIVGALVAALIGAPSLLTLLVVIWGGRLALRIYRKNKGKPEDARYAKWRAEWVWFKTRSFFQVFMLQGLIIAIIALPVIAIGVSATPISLAKVLTLLGLVLWVVGFLFESIGDTQLDRFIKSPLNKGKLMTSGLWHYTRHPNYFGESLMWWAIWLIVGSADPRLFLLALSSPILITHLLLHVSGIPMLEEHMKKHPDWAAYSARTNAFFPWFPKKIAQEVDTEKSV